uniref:Uncharacterized protein n=1 Tax=Nelumbo nucifera TaxID=4432 RepID=A0A822YXB8_NELNU|nr:TPA_asm: hypothetical protein HUJ06_007791 [Nelumbo nucifera]
MYLTLFNCPLQKQVLSHTVSISSMTHPVHHHPVQPHFPSFPPTPSTFPPSVFPPQPFPPTTYPPQSYPPHSGPCPGVYPPPSF